MWSVDNLSFGAIFGAKPSVQKSSAGKEKSKGHTRISKPSFTIKIPLWEPEMAEAYAPFL